MASKRILLIGGGGHCRSVLDCLLSLGGYNAVGIVEREKSPDAGILGVPIVGTDGELPALFAEGWTHAAVTLGSIGSPTRRRALFRKLKDVGFTLPPIVDPSAVIGREVSLGEGVFVGKRAVVNAGSQVGACAIINTGAIVEHDCFVGDFAHVSPGCTLCGGVVVGEDAHVGALSVVRQQLRIGAGALVGMGSVVVKDVAENAEAFGNPCREVRSR